MPTRRPVPNAAPMALVTDAWRPYIREPNGEINRRYYELCTLWQLRSALRSGNVWVEHSRRYANPDTYLRGRIVPRGTRPSTGPEKRSAPRAGQRLAGVVASRGRPLARSLRDRTRL